MSSLTLPVSHLLHHTPSLPSPPSHSQSPISSLTLPVSHLLPHTPSLPSPPSHSQSPISSLTLPVSHLLHHTPSLPSPPSHSQSPISSLTLPVSHLLYSVLQCRLIIARMSETKCERFNALLIPLAAAVAASFLVPSLEGAILYIFFGIVFFAHVHFGVSVVRDTRCCVITPASDAIPFIP